MKDLMSKIKGMRQAKLRSYGAKGPIKDKADDYRPKRAYGGRIHKDAGGSLGEMDEPMDGDVSKPRLDKKPRGNTTININLTKPGAEATAPPPAAAPPPPPPPMAGPPMAPGAPPMGIPPMGGPPPPGMPPLPMRAKGGRVKKEEGGSAGWSGEGDSGKRLKEKSAALSKEASGDSAMSKLFGVLAPAGALTAAGAAKMGRRGAFLANMGIGAGNAVASAASGSSAASARKKAEEASAEGDKAEGRASGGRANCDDDKPAKKEMGGPMMGKGRPVPPNVAAMLPKKRVPMGGPPAMPMPMRARGGHVDLDAGAATGEGRLEKRSWYRKHGK